MCDLLGMCFNLPVNPNFSFKNFRFKDGKNPDGWGVAFYPDNSAQIIKEKNSASESKLAKMLVNYDYVKSKIIIAHVRAGSSPSHKNTHPFSRELNGKEWVFAHNGTLDKISLKRLVNGYQFQPIGDTDSEIAFSYILQQIKENMVSNSRTKKDFEWLERVMKEINKYGTFNCILSNEEFLFCYADKNQYNKLSFIQRKTPFDNIHLLDMEKASSKQEYVNLAGEKNPDQKGYIISTTERTGKPTNENWKAFKGGELKVFKDGEEIK